MKDKLYRSRIDRVFGGVASGLAKYMNIDTILIRIVFIILAFFNGIGILIYIIMWIVIPEDPLFFSFGNPSEGPAPGATSDFAKNSNDQESNENKTSESKSSFQYPPYPPTPPKKSNGSGRLVIGIIFIGLGLVFLADRIFPYFDFEDFIPLIFVFIGIGLLWNSLKKRD